MWIWPAPESQAWAVSQAGVIAREAMGGAVAGSSDVATMVSQDGAVDMASESGQNHRPDQSTQRTSCSRSDSPDHGSFRGE